jgi:hypothetical protein
MVAQLAGRLWRERKRVEPARDLGYVVGGEQRCQRRLVPRLEELKSQVSKHLAT